MNSEALPLSVILPVYNAERYLAACMDSLLAQTFRRFELIVMDDGSTDRSSEILHRYAQRDQRIRLIRRENGGLISALNELLELARGRYVARMDADDVAHPGRFRQQLKYLEEHPDVVAAGTAYDIIDPRGCRLTRLVPPSEDAEIQDLLLRGHTAICHPTVLMRAAVARQIGGYDKEAVSVEDLDIFLRLGEVGRLANLPRALLRYRIHADSVSGRAGQAQREAGREVCRRAWERRGIPEDKARYEATDEWRPGPDRESRHRFALQYGWWAFRGGEWRAAVRYGARAARATPWRPEGWKLLACAALKPVPMPTVAPSLHMAPSRPLVSVLMPVYNAQPYLKEAIECVLDQSFVDFEFIVVDDGSTDSSPELLRRYAKADSRIRVVQRKNGGIVSALNQGLSVARGKYIARMDADDVCDPARFELQVERLESEPGLVALGSCATAMDPHGRSLGIFDVPLANEEIDQAHLAGSSSIHHPAVMMLRSALERAGNYREGFAPAEDFDLWLRLGEVGRLANLPQRLLCKRLTTSGIVGSTLARMQQVVSTALRDAWERRGLPGEPPPFTAEFRCKSDLYRQWGWMALQARNLRAARLYAARSVLHAPLREPSWRLAYCAVRGR